MCIMCTRQGGNRIWPGRTLRHPLASSPVLLQKVLLSSVSGLWEVPLRTRCHKCFTWVRLRWSDQGEHRSPVCPQTRSQERLRSDGEVSPPVYPVEISLSSWREMLLLDCCLHVLGSFTLSVQDTHPQQSQLPRSRLTPSPPNQKPPRPVLSPPPTSPFSSASSQ